MHEDVYVVETRLEGGLAHVYVVEHELRMTEVWRTQVETDDPLDRVLV
jgi:hypothetical protein